MIGNMIFLSVIFAHASGGTIADFEKTCIELKKKLSVCQCLSANLNRRLESKEISVEQIPVAIQALKAEPLDDEAKSFYYDNLADFLAGLEPHCAKNPKYNVLEP